MSTAKITMETALQPKAGSAQKIEREKLLEMVDNIKPVTGKNPKSSVEIIREDRERRTRRFLTGDYV